ncbi:MoxR family ATPase [Bremerella cremea]|uniref:MoxR family ATPase n=1 Tax=Bremerella cremea TaxID=1031537 RepID=A0A368KVV5_9BACT|nr:MoxR family ATPase [Bremerella cremea]RCS54560.1 MoxR family ATPase [Bremerella cremea]
MPAELLSLVSELESNINQVVVGKADVVRKCLVALLAGEHILLEDVPGVGKTLVGKALARSLSGHFCRLQFTPDLLPSDIVGSNIFNAKTNEFVYHSGPIFSNVVIADEINRSSPRTQSALLEAMSDQQVSVDGETHNLPSPFMVIATQNPFEFEGTYPLPESQLDRFLMRISMGYPDRSAERVILESHRNGEPVNELSPVVTCEQIVQLQDSVRKIEVSEAISEYLLDIIDGTRTSDDLEVGASTRAGLSLFRAAQSVALLEGRDFVVPDDVKQLAVPVLAHRVIPKGFLHAGQREAVESMVGRIVDEISIPV